MHTRTGTDPQARFWIALVLILSAFPLHAQTPDFSWQQPKAKVLESGQMEWTPADYEFVAGDTVRYIDFENGDDTAAGTKDAPWKHHPWDPSAAGNAAASEGPVTYVFKGGVAYRGRLMADESGKPGNPIRLTWDPSWGKGMPRFLGSVRLPQQWKKASAEDMPKYMPADQGVIWYQDIADLAPANMLDNKGNPRKNWTPYTLWTVAGDSATRLHLARDPDWQEGHKSFPVDYWHKWDGFSQGEKVDGKHVGRGGQDDDLKGKPEDYFTGGYLWSQWKGNMGTPTGNDINEGHYSPEHGTLFPTGWVVGKDTRYMLENLPQYLDSPGEFYFARDGEHKGRVYVRLPDDQDPNTATIEASAQADLIIAVDKSHIEISGIGFAFNDPVSYVDEWPNGLADSAAIRTVGSVENITVRNCRFDDVVAAFRAFPRGMRLDSYGYFGDFKVDRLDNIVVRDNDIRNCEREVICVYTGNSFNEEKLDYPDNHYPSIGHVEVLRNRMENVGFRQGSNRFAAIPAIQVSYIETAEIAGNFIKDSWGSGVMVHGGKTGGNYPEYEVPLTRILVYNNHLENVVTAVNDYGAMSLWQGGPIYCFNNNVGNVVGVAPDRNLDSPWRNVGYPYYIDGGYKIYTFNNISWGLSNDPGDPYRNNGTYFMVFGFLNPVINNTFVTSYKGIAGSSGNRNDVLGNIIADVYDNLIASNRMGDPSLAGGGDTGEMGLRGVPTLAYGYNLLHSDGDFYAGTLYKPNRRALEAGAADKVIDAASADEFAKQMREFPIRFGQLGWRAEEMPLVAPKEHDFRPKEGSKAINNGVRYFIPWSLYATVGEWHFNQNQAQPGTAIDYGFYMTEEWFHRKMYEYLPTADITFEGVTADDYIESPSENWVPGAIRLDGSHVGVVTDESLKADATVHKQNWMNQPQVSEKNIPKDPWIDDGSYFRYPGELRKTLDIKTSNLLIEANVLIAPGHTGGVIARKFDDSNGYRFLVTKEGNVGLAISGGGETGGVKTTRALNDGKWHHVLAEIDRESGQARIYVDGKPDNEAQVSVPADASLSNRADFEVGKDLQGAIDFLRVCQGTLEDARTTIEELYAWQTEGPATRDMTGKQPVDRRDIGALERR